MAKRYKTGQPGVYYIIGKDRATGESCRFYYISYYKDKKRIEERVSSIPENAKKRLVQRTETKAANIRLAKMKGEQPTHEERKEAEAKKKLAKKWTVERLFKEYQKNTPNRKDKKNDPSRFKNYISPNFGSKQPKEIAPLDVDRLRLKMLKNRAPSTVKNTLELLRRVCNYGVKNKLCEGLTFTIEMPKVNKLKTEDLTDKELASLLKAIEEDDHPHAGDMMLLALYSGMRRGEMFKLLWKNVKFKQGFIELIDPKGRVNQTIPLNDASRELLEKRPRFDNSPYVFPGRGGKQRTDINKAVNAIKKAAELPKDFRPLHGLRHTFASGLASSGKVDLHTLQKLLTHKSYQMVLRYAHLRDQAIKDASSVAADIFKLKKEVASNNVVDIKK